MAEPYTKPLPRPDLLTQGFWDGCKAHELRLLRCDDCGTYVHQPASMCHACTSTSLTWTPVSGEGVVYSWAIVHHAPLPGFQQETPYVLASIELAEQAGLRILSNVVDCDPHAVEADMPVRVKFVDVTPDVALPLFRPA